MHAWNESESVHFIHVLRCFFAWHGPYVSSISGGVMCVLSLVCALALGFFDKRADRILKRAAVKSGN